MSKKNESVESLPLNGEKTEDRQTGQGVAVASSVPQTFVLAVTPNEATPIEKDRLVQIMATGLRFLGDMTFEQWREALAGWKKISSFFHIGLSDFIEYGREKFGEEKVDETLELFDFDMADVMKAHAIGQLPLDLRDAALTAEHYYVLSKSLPGAKKEQGKWAAIAKKDTLSAIELKRSIEAGKVIRQEEIDQQSGRDSGVPNIEGLAMTFQRWTKQIGGEQKILEQPLEWKKKFLEEVHPIVELAQKVESTIPLEEPAEA
jgi:hypothetical protein